MSLSSSDAIRCAWRSPRLFAMTLLAVAVIMGAHYRFYRLDRWGMDSDEGVSWASASVSTIAEVVAEERQLDPGKLPLYDVTLHEWIGAFGDSPFALRAMSALMGTFAIVLLFFAVRELCRWLGDGSFAVTGAATGAATGELAGAFAALIYATNVMLVVSDRTARMYSMLVAAECLQIAFFVRAQRRGARADCLGAAIFTAVMIAANYSSGFLLFAEALWIAGLLVAEWTGAYGGRRAIVRPDFVLRSGLAVVAGVALLAPLLPGMFADSAHAVRIGTYDWIRPQPIGWPLTTLHDSANSPALFWIFAGLAVFAVWRKRHSAPLVLGFLALWTVGPLLAISALSWLVRPLEFPRYVLIAYVGMFAFAGFGAAAVRGTALRIVLALLIVYLSAPQVHAWVRNYRELDWRGAAAFAARETVPGQRIAVHTDKSVNVVRYYLPPDRRADAVSLGDGCGSARLLIIRAPQYLAIRNPPAARLCYPHVLARMIRLEVRAR